MKPIHLQSTIGNFWRIKISVLILSLMFTLNSWGQDTISCCQPWIPPTYDVDENHWDEPTSFWQNGGHIPENTVNEDTADYARAHIKASGSATLRVFDADNTVYSAGVFVGFHIKSRAFRDADFSGVTISTYLNGDLQESNTGDDLIVEYIPFYVNDPICIGFYTTLSWNAIEVHFDADGPRVHYDVFYAVTGNDCPPPPPTGETPPPLAVTWLSFDVEKKDETINLTWITSREYNSSKFEVERSSDGFQFNQIGTVNAAVNNNLEINEYSFQDMNPMGGNNYYRIRQVDFDEKYGYSAIRKISFGNGIGIKSWPNPATDDLYIEMPYKSLSAGEIKLINSTGIVIMNKVYDEGNQQTTLDVSGVEPGFYNLIIESPGQRHIERIVILK